MGDNLGWVPTNMVSIDRDHLSALLSVAYLYLAALGDDPDNEALTGLGALRVSAVRDAVAAVEDLDGE